MHNGLSRLRLANAIYRNDIATFAGDDAARVRRAFDSIPTQLSRKSKRFMFSLVKDDLRSRQLEGAMDWLEDAFMVNRCFRCTDPSVDLGSTADLDSYKCYLADTGLLVSQAFPGASLAGGVSRHDADSPRSAGALRASEGVVLGNVGATLRFPEPAVNTCYN